MNQSDVLQLENLAAEQRRRTERAELPPVQFTSNLLPADARAILQRAASKPIPPDDPLARQKAIEEANKRVRRMYPQFFKKEY